MIPLFSMACLDWNAKKFFLLRTSPRYCRVWGNGSSNAISLLRFTLSYVPSACADISYKSASTWLFHSILGLPLCLILSTTVPLFNVISHSPLLVKSSTQSKRALRNSSLIGATLMTFLIALFAAQSRRLMPEHHLSIFVSTTLARSSSFLVMGQH